MNNAETTEKPDSDVVSEFERVFAEIREKRYKKMAGELGLADFDRQQAQVFIMKSVEGGMRPEELKNLLKNSGNPILEKFAETL